MKGMLARRRADKAEKALHRPTAANCKYWTGDRHPVDWGTCTQCLPQARPVGRRSTDVN